jgi:hypothetical protein
MADLAPGGRARLGLTAGPLSLHAIAGTIIVLLWGLALWQSWECRGLYSDGSVYFLDMILEERLVLEFHRPRSHAIFLTQLPAMLAKEAGVSDLHWLARLHSLGLFGVPTALYSLAIVRAGRDALLLAGTLAAVAIVFMTTTFFIIGEYHTAYACAILAAVWIATASALRASDGWVLIAVAALAARSYEHSLYLGPLMALLTAWAIARATVRPWFATTLYGIAAGLFLFGGYVAAASIIDLYGVPEERTYLVSVLDGALGFRFNIQLDLLLVASASLVAWGVARPSDLRGPWPYLAALVLVLLVAVSPALVAFTNLLKPPYANPQMASRTAAGPLTALFVVFVWLHASGLIWRWLPSIPKEPVVSRRLVALAGAMVVATIPWNIMLAHFFIQYLEAVRMTIRSQSGAIAIEAAIFDRYPRLEHHDIAPSALSVIMRTSPTDGVLVNETRNPADLEDPLAPPNLGRFIWRD